MSDFLKTGSLDLVDELEEKEQKRLSSYAGRQKLYSAPNIDIPFLEPNWNTLDVLIIASFIQFFRRQFRF